MVNGFYRITFTGAFGSGFGVIVFNAGIVAGADVAGSTFDGYYAEQVSNDGIDFRVIMTAPAGVTPVQTGVPLTAPINIQIDGSLRESDIGTNLPSQVETSLGPVNVLFEKIRDF